MQRGISLVKHSLQTEYPRLSQRLSMPNEWSMMPEPLQEEAIKCPIMLPIFFAEN